MSEDYKPNGGVKARKVDGSEDNAAGLQDWLGEKYRVLFVRDMKQQGAAHLAINQPDGQPILSVLPGGYVVKLAADKVGVFDGPTFEMMFSAATSG